MEMVSKEDFTHISNVVSGNLLALTKEDVSEINGEVLNLAYGGTTTVNDLFFGIRDSISKFKEDVSSMQQTMWDEEKVIFFIHMQISINPRNFSNLHL